MLGGDRDHRPSSGPDSAAADMARREAAGQMAHRLLLEVDGLREVGITSARDLARAPGERGVPAPRGGNTWTHTTVARLLPWTSFE
jgi:hypothetical protein